MELELLYEGKAKKVYQSDTDENHLILSYKNDATAFNGEKKAQFTGKGRLNNEISSLLFQALDNKGIPSHFIERLDSTTQIVQKTDIIPLEVVIRNIATGSITKRLGIEEKTPFEPALAELFYKDDRLGDPLINDEHALYLTDIKAEELAGIKEKARKVNTALTEILLLSVSVWSILNWNSAETRKVIFCSLMRCPRIRADYGISKPMKN